jgi:two-component system response regulator VanR
LDLAVLDVMLPDMSGFTVCQEIRKRHTYPILMLTAKEEEVDKITGLTLGADDYITKPFRPLELVARVKAQFRRYKRYSGAASGGEDKLITVGGLEINEDTREVSLDGAMLALTPTEFTILTALCRKRGSVVSSEELFHSVWGDEYYDKNNNTITVHIRHLREKMKESFENPRYIKTVWGVGYKIETH